MNVNVNVRFPAPPPLPPPTNRPNLDEEVRALDHDVVGDGGICDEHHALAGETEAGDEGLGCKSSLASS